MKPLVLFTYILLTSLLLGCESETILPSTSNVVGTISTRVSNDITSLPTNSQALFHTSSGTSIFTFDGNHWNGNQSIFSFSSTTPNVLTALYPAYNGEKAITENPYTNNELEDVLIAQSTYTNEQNIELTFKHLFSTLTIHLLSPLKESITRISLEVPIIESLNADGSFSLSGTHQILPELNTEGSYAFIIPPKDNCTLTLHLTIGEETTSHPITHSFKSGYKYECNVKEPGIYNAEDLIEFSKVINMKKDGDLSRYGELQEDGRMLYRLYADIDFANVDSQELLPIGYYNGPSVIFSGIFDGQGHTISNLILPDKSINSYVETDYSGLFGAIGEKGVVKNLQIMNAKTVKSPSCTKVGGIAARNEGIIQNCSVQHSTLTSASSGLVGGICASMANGYIINCKSTNDTISASPGTQVGGIIGGSCGEILNCYTYDNVFSIETGGYVGGISGSVSATNTLRIANCYVKHLKYFNNNWGAIIGASQSNKYTFDNIFYNGGNIIANNENLYPNVYKYSQFCAEVEGETKHICDHLNKWIKGADKTFPFKEWTQSDTPPYPAIFK
ncbi:MAG: fimbrillin family protein [Bacteroidaceae bacterium]|nr:fimbrillin family protein [Bacteroidaceae bacterium]